MDHSDFEGQKYIGENTAKGSHSPDEYSHQNFWQLKQYVGVVADFYAEC